MIQEIATEKLEIHPKNVRKVYSDIGELAESIKARGVMQNLTVVPDPEKDGYYLVVIGNRRLTAARAAGLKTLPCSIIEMTEKEQISTMLLENMQRSDLSVTEQAQGFQLMLDLGETEESISEKTGFSRSTVRHRLNLAKLDQELLADCEKSEIFQLSLTDLYELEKVKDTEKRNKILSEALSSRELKWRVNRAVKEEKENKVAAEIMPKLEKMGVKRAPDKAKAERWSGKWKDVETIILEEWDGKKEIAIRETKDQLYYYRYNDRIYVVQKVKEEKKEMTEWEKQKKELDRRKKKVKAILKEMKETRKDFISEIISGNITAPKGYDPKPELWRIYMNVICRGGGVYRNIIFEFCDVEEYGGSEPEKTGALEDFKSLDPEKQMLILLSSGSEPYEPIGYLGEYNSDLNDLRDFYKVLQRYGFSFRSMEEIKILNGTHECYVKEEENADETE